jgi:four helix bundle protein
LDFIHKLSIAQKEANETMYWLELLFRSAYLTNEHRYEQIKTNLLEIQKIISSIIITTKNNLKK